MFNWQYGSIGPDNGLAPNRRQDIIWTNGGLVYWWIYAPLGLNEWKPEHTLYGNFPHWTGLTSPNKILQISFPKTEEADVVKDNFTIASRSRFSTMAADNLVTQEVIASTAMVLTTFARNIPVLASEILNRCIFHFQCVRECTGLFRCGSQPSLAEPPLGFCSQWVIKFNSLSRTSGIELHVIHISRAIITYTLEWLSSVTQITHHLQVNLEKIIWRN